MGNARRFKRRKKKDQIQNDHHHHGCDCGDAHSMKPLGARLLDLLNQPEGNIVETTALAQPTADETENED